MANPLHEQLAERILIDLRVEGLETGHHLTEAKLEKRLSASRSPIRAALTLLAERGIVEQIANKGFFVKNLQAAPDSQASGEDRIYLAIADDRLTGKLPQDVTESELSRHYDAPRNAIRRILTRIAREGWIEPREGRGYRFAPLIDSMSAYRENYQLRRMLEPQGLLCETFRVDPDVLARLRRQQEILRDGGWQSLGQIELFETNSQFHEGLAVLSGNRFLPQIIARQNQLRRLVEYRQTLNREQVRQQNEEHLAILDALETNEIPRAAELLAAHLESAMVRKARPVIFEGRAD
jgi:DNA-binding GntR family transcriptional regulator